MENVGLEYDGDYVCSATNDYGSANFTIFVAVLSKLNDIIYDNNFN